MKICFLLASITFLFTACSYTEKVESSSYSIQEDSVATEIVESSNSSQSEFLMEGSAATNTKVTINEQVFTAALEDNVATKAFIEMIRSTPISIVMQDHSGFEKVGSLGRNLPSENVQMQAKPGDIVLYNSNQIVVFYGSNSWSYTKIGSISDLSGWESALGTGDITITFSLDE